MGLLGFRDSELVAHESQIFPRQLAIAELEDIQYGDAKCRVSESLGCRPGCLDLNPGGLVYIRRFGAALALKKPSTITCHTLNHVKWKISWIHHQHPNESLPFLDEICPCTDTCSRLWKSSKQSPRSGWPTERLPSDVTNRLHLLLFFQCCKL